MAILDNSVTGSYNEDRDQNVFIGLDLPIRKSDGVEGYFASTSTTLSAVKNNIRYLLLTARGERIMHPDLGINVRNLLFEQMTEEVLEAVDNDIRTNIKKWLPFVTIKNIEINDSSTQDLNVLSVFVEFFINNDPRITDSVDVLITGD
jgi:phage baseplate assembly protein W